MEGYRSYSEPQSYPEGRLPYPDSQASEPDYPEGSGGWYGQREPERYDERAIREPERYDERAIREPERYDDPRRDHPRPSPGETARAPGTRPAPGPGGGPVSGGPPPHVGGPEAAPGPRRPVVAPGSPGPAGDSLYRSKRPALAALFWVPALVFEIPALLLLLDGLFGADAAVAPAVASAVCLMLALPLLAAGLYAVATGAVRAAGPNSIQAWLRPPVAYLTVGIVLFIAAGLAA